jgi:hypothetical protein
MIKGQNIICFGSESWDYPGFQQKVMRLASLHNKILYVNAIGTRKISLNCTEMPFYLNRVRRFFQRDREIPGNPTVRNPYVIPLVYNRLATRFNSKLAQIQFTRLLAKLNFKQHILWMGSPTAHFILDLLRPDLIIYNPVDRFRAFPFVNSNKIVKFERKIARRSDVIICTSDAIRQDLIPYNKYSFTISHGVEFDHFNSAFSNDTIPMDIRGIARPIIGYFGGLYHRVNYDLLYKVGIRYPDANIVLIGKKYKDLGKLENLANVYILGQKDIRILPLYLKQFTVCLIPYHVNDLTEAVDPIKLREYLCLGKPVVSVDLPEVRKLGGMVYIGEDEDDFVNKVALAIVENSSAMVQERIQAARASDWSVRIMEISRVIYEAFRRRKRHGRIS